MNGRQLIGSITEPSAKLQMRGNSH